MTDFFNFFVTIWQDIIGLLTDTSFDLFGLPVNLASLLFVFLVIGFVISAFWRGSRA